MAQSKQKKQYSLGLPKLPRLDHATGRDLILDEIFDDDDKQDVVLL